MPPPIYGHDCIYRSPRPPISLPEDPTISMLPFLFRNLSSLAQSTALIDSATGQRFNFYELKDQVSKLSAALLKLNITKNDVVLIFSPNSVYFPISFLAVVGIGAIATTVNPLYTISELSKQAKDCRPKLVITVSELYPKAKNLNLPCILLNPKDSVTDHSAVSGQSSLWYVSDLIRSINLESESGISWPSVVQSDVAALLYSSGTTGTSKGVVLTHRNFIAAALMATSDQDVYGDPKNVFLCFLPMFHVLGLSVITYAQLQRGNALVVMANFVLEKVLSAVQKYGVTHLYAVPPVVIALINQKELVKRYDLSSLKELLSAAAPLGKDVMEECAMIIPTAAIVQGYGMTETCSVISFENPKTGTRLSGASGTLTPGVESRIIDISTKKSLPPLQKGEIVVRGPNMMRGYLNNQKATDETIDKDGWLYTGDLGYFDEEGQIYVVDRIKELIKCKGFQVAPAELEELLLTHPEILDAAVVPSPDPEAGEVPVAYVVRSPGSSVTEKEVQKFISKQVASYKRLRRVIFIEVIPKSASGKILRRELIKNVRSKL